MHFIITDAWLARSHAIHLSGAKLLLALALTSVALMAMAAGLSRWVVVAQDVHPAYGNVIEIDHGNGLVTRYAHVSRFLVRKGDLVRRGQRIAEVGSSGRSTGPHLHFEVLVGGIPQNPQKFLAAAPDAQVLRLAHTHAGMRAAGMRAASDRDGR